MYRDACSKFLLLMSRSLNDKSPYEIWKATRIEDPKKAFLFACLKLNKSLVTLVFMNQSPKARVPLEKLIITEFLNIWWWGPGPGTTGHSLSCKHSVSSCLSSQSYQSVRLTTLLFLYLIPPTTTYENLHYYRLGILQIQKDLRVKITRSENLDRKKKFLFTLTFEM